MKRKHEEDAILIANLELAEDFLVELAKNVSIFQLFQKMDWKNSFRTCLESPLPEPTFVNYLKQECTLAELANCLIPCDENILKSALFPDEQSVSPWKLNELKMLLHAGLLYSIKQSPHEVIDFFNASPLIANQLLLHANLSEPFALLMELIIQEDACRKKGEIGYEWSINSRISESLISFIEADPSYFDRSAVHIVQAIVSKCSLDCATLKAILVEHEFFLVRHYYSQLFLQFGKDIDLVNLLGESIFPVYLFNRDQLPLNSDNQFFCDSMCRILREETAAIETMFVDDSTDLYPLLTCLKYLHVLVTHGLTLFLQNGERCLFRCIDLCPVYPNSNLLHNAVFSIFEQLIIVSSDVDESSLICLLVKDGLIKKIIDGLKVRGKIAYRYHFRLIADVLRDSISNVLRAVLESDEYWNNFVSILDEIEAHRTKVGSQFNDSSGTQVQLAADFGLESEPDASNAQMLLERKEEVPSKLTWKQIEELLIVKLEKLTMNDSG